MGWLWNLIKETFARVTEYVIESDFFKSLMSMLYDVVMFVVDNLYNVYILIKLACPYVMLYLGVYLYEERGAFRVGGEFFIPVFMFAVSSFIHRYANMKNKGDSIPVPKKRFTETMEDGYSINQDEVNEVILYVGEVEDYLERKGLL